MIFTRDAKKAFFCVSNPNNQNPKNKITKKRKSSVPRILCHFSPFQADSPLLLLLAPTVSILKAYLLLCGASLPTYLHKYFYSWFTCSHESKKCRCKNTMKNTKNPCTTLHTHVATIFILILR